MSPRPRSARALILAAGCVIALGLVLGVTLPRLSGSRPAHPAAALPSLPTAIRPAGPGHRLVTVHGLTIEVPTGWPVLIGHPCGTATTNQVILPGSAQLDCAPGRAAGLTTVDFAEGATLAAGDPIQLDGFQATRSRSTDVRSRHLVIGVPVLQVSVDIAAPDPAAADRLASTLQITGTDGAGCASFATGTLSVQGLPPPHRAGADRALIPADPDSVRLCRYQDGWLEQSASVPAEQVSAFVSSLNAQPSGLSDAVDPDRARCHTADPSQADLTGDSAPDSVGYLVHAHYPGGPDVTVAVRLGRCGRLGASNGSRTGQLTDSLRRLLGPAGLPG